MLSFYSQSAKFLLRCMEHSKNQKSSDAGSLGYSCLCHNERIVVSKKRRLFDAMLPDAQSFKCRIMKMVYEGGYRMKGNKYLGPRKTRFRSIKERHWFPPNMGFTLFCCDGASFGILEWLVLELLSCQVIGTLSGGIGLATNYIAEVYAVVCAVDLAVEWDLEQIILNSDSKAVISDFAKGLEKLRGVLRGLKNHRLKKLQRCSQNLKNVKACIIAGMVEKAVALAKEMRGSGIEPNQISYSKYL